MKERLGLEKDLNLDLHLASTPQYFIIDLDWILAITGLGLILDFTMVVLTTTLPSTAIARKDVNVLQRTENVRT